MDHRIPAISRFFLHDQRLGIREAQLDSLLDP
jgi:hypothetical protein